MPSTPKYSDITVTYNPTDVSGNIFSILFRAKRAIDDYEIAKMPDDVASARVPGENLEIETMKSTSYDDALEIISTWVNLEEMS